MSILDGAAHDRHLQADAASGRQGGVPLPGRRSPDRRHPAVAGGRLSAPGTLDLSHWPGKGKHLVLTKVHFVPCRTKWHSKMLKLWFGFHLNLSWQWEGLKTFIFVFPLTIMDWINMCFNWWMSCNDILQFKIVFKIPGIQWWRLTVRQQQGQ